MRIRQAILSLPGRDFLRPKENVIPRLLDVRLQGRRVGAADRSSLANQWHWYWAGPGGGYADASKDDHIVHGGTFNQPASGNGARLANIMISKGPEGARFALLREGTPLPKRHPVAKAP
jgi:hypothetical protein